MFDDMLKNYDELIRFCLEHGGTLRNHKQFGELAQRSRLQVKAAEQFVKPTPCPSCGGIGGHRFNCEKMFPSISGLR